jgi:hypothetical protein
MHTSPNQWVKYLSQRVKIDILPAGPLLIPMIFERSWRRRRRGGSPKPILWNNALVNPFPGRSLRSAKLDTGWWGRLVENAVGAHLRNSLPATR